MVATNQRIDTSLCYSCYCMLGVYEALAACEALAALTGNANVAISEVR